MIVVTGAAGFIGSSLISRLNAKGFSNIVAVDDFSRSDKLLNLENKCLAGLIHRNHFQGWFLKNHRKIAYVFHLGARTDTAEMDRTIFDELNVSYSQRVWNLCTEYQIPLTYASSAATYGDGSLGYEDTHKIIDSLHPLNPYGQSKNEFDQWVLTKKDSPPTWHGLKFFNVYGPNEYHKGRMASVVWHAYNQIRERGSLNLFRSHRPDFLDGQQSRDFVYIRDILEICLFCFLHRPPNGIYNAGTGEARSFLDLGRATFMAMGLEPRIQFIDTPLDIRDTYQYFTKASMQKLSATGYATPRTTLEEGIREYVQEFLIPGRFL